MLDTLDTLIAFVVVVLGFSLVVTTLNQIIASTLSLRGQNLLWGIQVLLEDLHSELPASLSAEVTKAVLSHRLISDSIFAEWKRVPEKWKLATAIRFDELLSTVATLAGQRPAPQGAPKTLDEATAWLNQHLRITRDRFESMMDRTSQRFTMHMKVWTVVFSILLAFASHFDTILLLEHLSTDSALRTTVAAQAESLKTQANTALATTPNDQNLQKMEQRLTDLSAEALSPKLHLLGTGAPIHGWTGFSAISKLRGPTSEAAFKHLSGILISCVLLSFGAPFWFAQLKALTNLRSVVATQEEKSRTQSASAPAATSPIAARDLPPSP